jgi:hypothetical protein
MGMWFWTRHSALKPQDPGHGSRHLLEMHACVGAQSVLTLHSGRQLGGDPTNSGRQEQDGTPPASLHSEFGPQGDGTQGLTGSWNTGGGGGGGGCVHLTNGSPIRPAGQLQMGL